MSNRLRPGLIAPLLAIAALGGASGLLLWEKWTEEQPEPEEHLVFESDKAYQEAMAELPAVSGGLDAPIRIVLMGMDPEPNGQPLVGYAWLRLENPNDYPICFWGEGSPARVGDRWNEPGPSGWQEVNVMACATGISKITLPPNAFMEVYASLLQLQRQQVILTFYREGDLSVRSEQVIFETP